MQYQQTESAQSAQEIINDLLSNDIDMEEVEMLYIDMLHHYLRPTSDWNLGLQNTANALDNSFLMVRFLRILKRYQRHSSLAKA